MKCARARTQVKFLISALLSLPACVQPSASKIDVVFLAGVEPVANTPFSHSWEFNAAPDPTLSYAFTGSAIDFTGGVCRLTASDRVDDDQSAGGFLNAAFRGVDWNSTSAVLKLDSTGTPTNHAELDRSWAPKWANIDGLWHLNETSTGSGGANMDFQDSSSGGHWGRAMNSLTLGSAGHHHLAPTFNGTSHYIRLPDSVFDTHTQGSVSAWIKITSQPASGAAGEILASGSATAVNNMSVFDVYADSASTMKIRVGARTANSFMKGNTSLVLNRWYHVVATGDGTAWKLYVNGVPQTLTAVVGTNVGIWFASQVSGTMRYTIGNMMRSSGNGSYFPGTIDEVAVWNTVLSPEDVSVIYGRQSAKYSGSTVSRILDAFQTGMSWTTLSWIPTLPFLKELPDYSAGAIQNESSDDYVSLVGSTGMAAANDLMSGILGLWHLNESTPNAVGGNDFRDNSGTNRHMDESGGVVFGLPGRMAGAAGFNGVDEYASVAMDGTGLTVLSVAFWVRPTNNADSTKGIFQWTNALSTSTPFILIRQNTTSFGFFMDGTYRVTTPLVAGEWQHIALTLDSNDLWTTYVNGISVGSYQDDATRAHQANAARLYLGNGHNGYFNGSIDEFSVWSRDLHADEIFQLYRRGANRIKFQVRNCTAADCSDDLSEANWKGPDGTNQTYFSELQNNGVPLTGSGDVKPGLPAMLFTAFANPTNPVGVSRHFQYRTILESDGLDTGCNYGSGATWCSPELKSVTIDPVHYDSAGVTVIGKSGVSYESLASFSETIPASGCPSGVSYSLGQGAAYASASWYWWDSAKGIDCMGAGAGAWCPSNGTAAESNDAATISANAAKFGSQVGVGTVFFKAHLRSSGTSKCELDQLDLTGSSR